MRDRDEDKEVRMWAGRVCGRGFEFAVLESSLAAFLPPVVPSGCLLIVEGPPKLGGSCVWNRPILCLLYSQEKADLAQTWPWADARHEASAEWQPALHQGAAEPNVPQVGDLSQVGGPAILTQVVVLHWVVGPFQVKCFLRMIGFP